MKISRLSPLAALLLMSVAAEGSDLGGSTNEVAAPTDVPSSTEETAVEEKKVRAAKDPAKALDIMNGRMPLPLVFLIRFVESADRKASELAKDYGTSVGKVFDIRKGSNFGYVTAEYKASKEEIDAAIAFVTTNTSTTGKSLQEIGGQPVAIQEKLSALPVATAEEVAARNWTVKTVGVKKEVDPNAPVVAKAPRNSKSKSKAADEAPVAKVAGQNMF